MSYKPLCGVILRGLLALTFDVKIVGIAGYRFCRKYFYQFWPSFDVSFFSYSSYGQISGESAGRLHRV